MTITYSAYCSTWPSLSPVDHTGSPLAYGAVLQVLARLVAPATENKKDDKTVTPVSDPSSPFDRQPDEQAGDELGHVEQAAEPSADITSSLEASVGHQLASNMTFDYIRNALARRFE